MPVVAYGEGGRKLFIIIDVLILSVLFYGGVFLMIKINPRSQLHNYPAPIREAVPPKDKGDKKTALLVGIPMFALIVGYMVYVSHLRFHGTLLTYGQVLLHWTIVFLLTSVIDLVICDYLIFCVITPLFIVVPGTEGHRAYKDKSYHTRTVPRMIIISLVLGALASLTYLLK